MRFRLCGPVVLLAALAAGPAPAGPPAAATPAVRAWEQGQAALDQDRLAEAVGQFQLSLRLDPQLPQGHLGLATAYLALGQSADALPHLRAYLAARPDHFLVRWHYAEALLAADRPGEARAQLGRFVADAQEQPRVAEDHLIACHTRLMEIAERQGDDYAEHLHRGIGLYLLARKRSAGGDGPSRRLAEELFCKAAAELTLARLRRPQQARPCWYLYGVWTSLAQRQPALRCLRAAERSGPLNDLTPAEQRELHLASAQRRQEALRK
jgi:tetratricopeptide (TPR) repeat protein